MAAPGFYNAADQDLYDQGNYFLPQEQYRLNLGTDTGAPNRVEFNPSQEGIGSLQQSYPFPNFDGNIADARSGSYSTNPGIGFSNRDLEDTNPNLGNNDGPDTSNMDAQGNYSDSENPGETE